MMHIAPPPILTRTEANVWRRITDVLLRRDEWKDTFVFAALVAARACAQYVTMARAEPALSDHDVEECRVLACGCLASMTYFARGREHVALVRADGLDMELVALCEPLEGDF